MVKYTMKKKMTAAVVVTAESTFQLATIYACQQEVQGVITSFVTAVEEIYYFYRWCLDSSKDQLLVIWQILDWDEPLNSH